MRSPDLNSLDSFL
ncbi:unnamed protein product [Acanthoscelides obtectus]|uniref:Uncharacterized protein n=1 Tax=Acanthoscelides obtectus TaxID=200917 RepID=A0A9P0M667_ACAOB|nr:unnamed protein product [Acanthoscelides obtectus]CAK1657880.1 hypothetical protein AOBTE_LOCUS20577 [Acanthoscelides obtectus]